LTRLQVRGLARLLVSGLARLLVRGLACGLAYLLARLWVWLLIPDLIRRLGIAIPGCEKAAKSCGQSDGK